MKIRLSQLRKLVREEVEAAALLEGLGVMKAGTLEDLKSAEPRLHAFVSAKYRDEVPKLKVVFEKPGGIGGAFARRKPYVYVPSEDVAVSWVDGRPVFHSSPTLLGRLVDAPA